MQNRRKTIVINKKFQHQYALLMVVGTVLFTNILIILRALFPGDEPFYLSMGTAITIALIETVLIAGVWFISLRLTHRIAGPVYVFCREIEAFANGDLSARIRLRKGDMFLEEADKINASLAKIEVALRARGEAGE